MVGAPLRSCSLALPGRRRGLRKRLVGQVRRRGVVLDVPADGPGVIASVNLAGNPQGHIDSCGDGLAGDQVPVDDVPGVAYDGPVVAGLQGVLERMVGGPPPASRDAGLV